MNRDQDLDFWWQLPEDFSRRRSLWSQLFVDLATPATYSMWHRKVAECRVRAYDCLRPTIVRLTALAVMVAGVAAVGAPAWVWLLLVPSVIQIVVEFLVGRGPRSSGRGPRLSIAAAGCAVAGPLGVVAVSMAYAGSERGWAKVAALAASIFLVNSSLGSLLLDPQNYAERSSIPRWVHLLRPYASLLSFLLITGIIAGSIMRDRWEQNMVPVALMCAALALLLGGTVRNHDRMITAAVPPARQAIEEGREDLGRMIHDQLGPIKAAAEGTAQIKTVPIKLASNLASLPALLTHFHTRTGIFDSQRMDLGYLAVRILEPYGLWEHFTMRLDWGEINDGDHQTAVTMTTALLHNVAQELAEPESASYPKDILLEGFTTGQDEHKMFHLAVRDHLPPIADWCPPGRSMTELRDMLRTDHNGDLTQEVMPEGTKRIVASWADVIAIRSPEEEFEIAK